jgi:OmpA-OmpF porin, OOP family
MRHRWMLGAAGLAIVLQTERVWPQGLTDFRVTARGIEYTLSSIPFYINQIELGPAGEAAVDRVALGLRQFQGRRLILEGHTDSSESAGSDPRLSLLRARTVRARLVAAGLDSALISAFGLGAAVPVAPNDTPDGRRLNRRVVLIIVDAAELAGSARQR